MSIDDLLVCGVCHGELRELETAPVCGECGRTYRRRGDAPDLTPIPPPDETVRSKWSLWEELQANGEISYREEAVGSLSIAGREDAASFGRFCRLTGVVLDVGCGPQSIPSYAGGERFVGIDPLSGYGGRQFDFVQGLGEYLPFRSHTFDHVIYATSLDHLIDPVAALREAARVLKPGGTIEIWSGELPPPPTAFQVLVRALELVRHGQAREFAHSVRQRLRPPARTQQPRVASVAPPYRVPEGAADAFHFFEPTKQRVDDTIVSAGLRIAETGDTPPGQRFLRLTPAADRASR